MSPRQHKLDKASRLFRDGQYERARKELKRLAKGTSDTVDVRLMLGFCERDRGRSFDAVRHFERAEQLAPDDYRAPFQLACAWDELGDHGKAEAGYRRSLELNPDNHQAYSNLGNALQDVGRKAEAIQAYRKALSHSSTQAATWYNLATACLDPDAPAAARDALEAALRYAPDMGQAWFDLATVHWASGDESNCERCLDEVRRAGLMHLVDSLDYVRALDGQDIKLFGDAFDVLRFAVDAAPAGGVFAEFGVSFGNSIRFIAGRTERKVHGFDSFEGLPEAWANEPKGMYTTRGVVPDAPANVEFHVGWFSDTVPPFAEGNTEPVTFANIDCDLYSSTVEVLETIGPFIPRGGIVAFDEYIGHPTWRADEFRAFQEYIESTGRTYRYLGVSFMSRQAVVVLDA